MSACGAQNCCILHGRCSHRELANLRVIPQRIAVSKVTETGRTLVHDMMRLVPFAFSVDQKFIERARETKKGRGKGGVNNSPSLLTFQHSCPSKCNLQLPHAQTIYLPALTNKRSILESNRVEFRPPPNGRHLPGVLQIKKSAKTRQTGAGQGRVRRTHAQPIS